MLIIRVPRTHCHLFVELVSPSLQPSRNEHGRAAARETFTQSISSPPEIHGVTCTAEDFFPWLKVCSSRILQFSDTKLQNDSLGLFIKLPPRALT